MCFVSVQESKRDLCEGNRYFRNNEKRKHEKVFIIIVEENDAMLSAHRVDLRQVAKLRWDGAIELVREKVPKKTTMRNETDHIASGSPTTEDGFQ